jgi:hypothetical protein
MGMVTHTGSCPSIYPAQQEPDALTRLVRWVRAQEGHIVSETEMYAALALISEAREEQRRARSKGWNDGLEEAARWLEVTFDQPTMAKEVRAKRVAP